ncbi:MAG TPA: beta-ketoacyl-ACP synthase III [Clostridia bacterium]
MSFRIAGVGSALADLTVDNFSFEKILDTSDEWITTRTGIKTRNFITQNSLTYLAATASKNALDDAGLSEDDLDLIIAATLQGDYIMPSLACLVQKELNASCPAFDLNAACTGFLYALDLADAYFKAGKAKNILIVCADQMSKFLDFSDRSTCVLFGDAAGAAVLTQGSALKYIEITAQGEYKNLHIESSKNYIPFAKNRKKSDQGCLKMNGQNIFKFAVSTVTQDIKKALQKTSLKSDDIKYYLIHQANKRILETAQSFLGESSHKFPTNLQRLGNTSAASIPILLDELKNKDKLYNGDLLVLCAFGGGMTAGTAITEWSY